MRFTFLLGAALLVGWTGTASAACINNHTDGTLYVDQYSLVSDEDIFAVPPGQRVCRTHTGLFHRYDVGLMPYENSKNLKLFYLSRDSDEFFVEGTCAAGGDCKSKLKFMLSDGTKVAAKTSEHASR